MRTSTLIGRVLGRTGWALIAGSLCFALTSAASGGARTALDARGSSKITDDVPISGNPETLRHKYELWKEWVADAEPIVVMALHGSKGLSSGQPAGNGRASVHLLDGTVDVEVQGLPEYPNLDVWFVENARGKSVRPGAGDRFRRVGALVHNAQGDRSTLKMQIARDPGFFLDLVVVTPAGQTPDRAGLLFGTPTLFQRWYAQELSKKSRPDGTLPLMALGLSVGGAPEDLAALVALGEQIFFVVPFNGNGRTCGSCHPAGNNFTLDPGFISRLPANDPLFVAEFNPNLAELENPTLMRDHALILENVDGFPCLIGECSNSPTTCCAVDSDCETENTCLPADQRFVMRGVPHLFGLGFTKGVPPDTINPPNESLGWGGDGAPFNGDCGGQPCSGTLRDFAVGAIRQHFTKTLERQEGECLDANADFCLPTSEELTALEAFQLSLGRQSDMTTSDLADLLSIMGDSCAKAGGETFNSPFDRCRPCHVGAGANIDSGDPDHNGPNDNLTTGVELSLQLQFPVGRPPDGGFGTTFSGHPPLTAQNSTDAEIGCPALDNVGPLAFTCPELQVLDGSFGTHAFNIASTIEAADTPPFFHNNVETFPGQPNSLEGAVAFYATDSFKHSAGVSVEPFSVDTISRFLRVLNSLDNIDSQIVPPIHRALCLAGQPGMQGNINALLDLALGHLTGTIAVVNQEDSAPCSVFQPTQGFCADSASTTCPLSPDPEPNLTSAKNKVRHARLGGNLATVLPQALNSACLARQQLAAEACPWPVVADCD